MNDPRNAETISLELSRRVDGEQPLDGAPSGPDEPAVLRQERRASERLRAELTPGPDDLHELRSRLEALHSQTHGEEQSRERAARDRGQWALLAAAAAAAFVVGASVWFALFRANDPNAPIVGPTPTGPTAAPEAIFVLEKESEKYEQVPIPGDVAPSVEAERFGLRTRTRRVLVDVPGKRKRTIHATPDREVPDRNITVELERVETQLIRYAPRPWQ